MARRFLFSDESGDLSFVKGPNISKYFAVGTLAITEPELRHLRATLAALRDDLALRNHGLDSYFHATADSRDVRLAVFEALSSLDFRFDVTLLEKAKADPRIRPDCATFFGYAWYSHMEWVAPRTFAPDDEALIVAAELGTRRTRKAFRGAIEQALTRSVNYRVRRTLAFWPCASDFALQAADYCTWAVTRGRERGDDSYLNLVAPKIRNERDLLREETKWYF